MNFPQHLYTAQPQILGSALLLHDYLFITAEFCGYFFEKYFSQCPTSSSPFYIRNTVSHLNEKYCLVSQFIYRIYYDMDEN